MLVTDLLTALGVCVLLPVLIVWLVLRFKKHETDRKTEILLKAMESGIPIDENLLKTTKKPKSIKKDLIDRLTGACVTTLMGISFLCLSFWGKLIPGSNLWEYTELAIPGGILLAIGSALFISFFIGRKMLSKDIDAEEKALAENTGKE